MKVVERSGYSGWNDYPVYQIRNFEEYTKVCKWMAENNVKYFLLSSGYSGYVFQVKSNAEWFSLRWE